MTQERIQAALDRSERALARIAATLEARRPSTKDAELRQTVRDAVEELDRILQKAGS